MSINKIKVGFEFTLLNPQSGGAFQYSFYILKLLAQIDRIDQVSIFCTEEQEPFLNEFEAQEKFRLIRMRKYNFITRRFKKLADYFMNRYINKAGNSPYLYRLYRILNPDNYYINRFGFDIFHVPWQVSPVHGIKAPVIITVHDLQQLHFPEFFSAYDRLYRAITFTKSILESDQVISSFNHVKDDVQKYFGVGEDQTSVCPVPVNLNCFTTDKFTSEEVLKEKYNLSEEFVLTPAATWPHKNHVGVLNALRILKEQGRIVHWIATGFKQTFFDEVIAGKIEEFGLADQVLFTDVVSEEDLIGLYKIATLVVMPTLYEAGSGPLFESMRYNVPVICSNVTSLPETIGNEAYVFDPYDHKQMAEMIMKGLENDEYRKVNQINSKARLDYYAQFDYKQPIIEAYSKAIAQKRRM
jgi:glycosyltransferase involved in cell wall biosynthesis